MRKLGFVVVLLLLLGVAAAAQDVFPRTQVFGGYSLVGGQPGQALNGWLAGGEYDRWNHIGAEAELTGGYGGRSSAYSLNVGPRVFFVLNGRKPKRAGAKRVHLTLFAHVLVGGTHFSSSSAFDRPSRTAFSWIPGAGVELPLGQSWAWRFSIDGLRSNVFGRDSGNSPRFVVGFVHSFGRKS